MITKEGNILSNSEDSITKNNSSKQHEFDLALLEYCSEIYEGETKRQHSLENKAQFYLSFVTLILGALFFNLDFIEKIKGLLSTKIAPSIITITFIICILILAISLLASLTFILKSIHLQSYRDIYPQNVTQLFLNPESEYFTERTPTNLYFTKSMNYTIALEHNKQIEFYA